MSVRLYLLGLLAPLVIVATMNEVVDPSGTSSTGPLSSLAAAQGEHDLIVSPVPLEHRAWARARLVERKQCPEVLVTGSSTVGHFSGAMFPGATAMNAFLAGPTVEDFEALVAILRRAACRPRVLVLGVDPWWLGNPTGDERRWMMLADDYLEYHAGAPFPYRVGVRVEVALDRLEDRLNFTTTRESLKLLAARSAGATTLGPQLVHETPSELCAHVTSVQYIRAADGHYVACPFWVAKPPEREVIASRYLRDDVHGMNEWRVVSDETVDRFARLVQGYSRAVGPVVLVGMPYHPTTWATLRADEHVRKNLDLLDGRLARLASDSVEVMLLRDPALVGLSGEDFEDSHHVSEDAAGRIAGYLSGHTRALGPRNP